MGIMKKMMDALDNKLKKKAKKRCCCCQNK